jgi:hypothetical protein
MEFIVYAAGPIAAVDYEGATAWREKLQADFDRLVQTGDRIRVASPMRGKDFFKRLGNQEIGAYYDFKDAAWNNEGAAEEYQRCCSSPRPIMHRDMLVDVRRSHLIFMNLLGAKRTSLGTPIEVGGAYMLNKPIVALIEPDSVYRHPMLDEACTIQTADWDVAVKIAANILLPNIRGIGEVARLGMTIPLGPALIGGNAVGMQGA